MRDDFDGRSFWCRVAFGLLVAAAVGGCGKRDSGVQISSTPAAPAAPAAAAPARSKQEYQVAEVTSPAVLRGTVRYAGTAPARPAVVVNSDQQICGAHEILPEDLIVSATGGVRNAVVWIEGLASGKAWSEDAVVQDQQGCVFHPHVAVVGVHRPITFTNSDPVVHNVRTFAKQNLPLNFSLLAKGNGQPITKSFILPDEMKTVCDSHKWMGGWLLVRDNPYFAITDENGNYQIDGVPAGNHKVVYWHESLEKVERQTELAAGQELVQDLDLKVR